MKKYVINENYINKINETLGEVYWLHLLKINTIDNTKIIEGEFAKAEVKMLISSGVLTIFTENP